MKRIHKVFRFSLIDVGVVCALMVVLGISLILFVKKDETVYVLLSAQDEYTASPYAALYQQTETMREGDKIFNSFGRQVAEIVETRTSVFWGAKRYIWIVVKMKAKYDKRSKIYAFNDTELLIGNVLSLNVGKVSFTGKILNVFQNPDDKFNGFVQKNAAITILYRAVDPVVADVMRRFEAKNSRGETIAKIVDTRITPQEIDVHTDYGGVVRGYSTIYKDVLATMRLVGVLCAAQSCLFNQTIDLKVGNYGFWVNSSDINLPSGLITSVQIDDQ